MTRLLLGLLVALFALATGAPAHAQTCVLWQTEPPPYPVPQGVCAPIDIRCTRPLTHTCDWLLRTLP